MVSDPEPHPARRTRRAFLRFAAGSVGAALLACSGGRPPATGAAAPRAAGKTGQAASLLPTPEPTPRPVPPAGRAERMLLPGTPWETPLAITHSGVRGPAVLVLGGVHGNEPGGWLAAEQVAGWTPRAGSLLVVPHANVIAMRALERTFPELGDLNRLYPGSADGLPMARMAAAIVGVAQEFGVELLLDMHESWGFYAERTQNGTAFLGQTITSGQGPASASIAQALAARANDRLEVARDRMLARDSSAVPGASATPTRTPTPGAGGAPAVTGRNSSSLGLGRWVDGLTPILVEMGQDRQSVERRVELHLLVGRALLDARGML